MQRGKGLSVFTEQEKLFMSLADGVSDALLQIAMVSELGEEVASQQNGIGDWHSVHKIAQTSLYLLEGYALTMRLDGGTANPDMQPVAMASLLYDVAHQLEPYAKQLAVSLELDMPRRLEPAVSDQTILQSALVNLGQVFITAQSQSDAALKPVRLSVHKSRYGIVAGWYSPTLDVTALALRRARKLRGWAHQPFNELVSGPATGVFIADSLLEAIATKLHVARYHNADGLAATLPTCQQIQLV